MILNQTAEYAFRAMAFLAIQYGTGPVTSQALSDHTRIPSFYLSKVMRRLVLAGLVTSQRGQGGGFALAREPHAVRFIDILEAVDFYADQGRCAFGIGSCNREDPCPLHPAWSALQTDFNRWARTNRLDSLTGGSFPEFTKDVHREP